MRWVSFALLCAACSYNPNYDPKVQCPRAAQEGIRDKSLTACAILGTRDRKREFVKANALKAACNGDLILQCSGVTHGGQPVRFKCDSNGCEWIPRWLW